MRNRQPREEVSGKTRHWQWHPCGPGVRHCTKTGIHMGSVPVALRSRGWAHLEIRRHRSSRARTRAKGPRLTPPGAPPTPRRRPTLPPLARAGYRGRFGSRLQGGGHRMRAHLRRPG
eukprot:986112-Rhodomonas_salina.1